jgi:predicted XRE-type DNA-binding protein
MTDTLNTSRGILDEEALARAAGGPHPHKADLVRALHHYRVSHDLTMTELGARCGIAQTRLSKLYKGKFAEVSSDKLLVALARLGAHVTVAIDFDPPSGRGGMIEIDMIPSLTGGEQ